MSRHPVLAGETIVASLSDSLCRKIRISDERIKLARNLEILARSRPDCVAVSPRGLEDVPSYRRLAEEGLTHASLRRAGGIVILLAASNRVWRRPELKKRLVVVKRDARRLGRRVVLVTKRGLLRHLDRG